MADDNGRAVFRMENDGVQVGHGLKFFIGCIRKIKFKSFPKATF